ncbi:MAG: WYL domain-containing protein [Actinomycetaceae bacterium]|nr:WYL domain-containing protein [Actinomycetaceae bacterium]
MSNIDISLARKAAILAFLAEGPVSLAQLATRFNRSWTEIYTEITKMWTVDVRDAATEFSPFDFDFYDEEVGPDTLVELTAGSDHAVSQPHLTLAEAVAVLGVLDQLLRAADANDFESLIKLRQRIADAATQAGYGPALWPAPQLVAAPAVITALGEAIENRHWVEIIYWKSTDGKLASEKAQIAPITLSTGANPLVIAANRKEELRRYRLDRITGVEITNKKYFKKLARQITTDLATDDGGFGAIDVILTCEPQARWVAESIPGAQMEVGDDHIRLSFRARNIDWLRTLLIRLGHSVLKIEPDAVAHEIADTVEQIYQETQ